MGAYKVTYGHINIYEDLYREIQGGRDIQLYRDMYMYIYIYMCRYLQI